MRKADTAHGRCQLARPACRARSKKNAVHAGAPTTTPHLPSATAGTCARVGTVLPKRGFATPRQRSQAGAFWGAASSPWDTHPREARERHTTALVEGPDHARVRSPSTPTRNQPPPHPHPHAVGGRSASPPDVERRHTRQPHVGAAARLADAPAPTSQRSGRQRLADGVQRDGQRQRCPVAGPRKRPQSRKPCHAAARSAACNPTLGQAVFQAAATPVALVPRWAFSSLPPTPPPAPPDRRQRVQPRGRGGSHARRQVEKWGARRLGVGRGDTKATANKTPPTPVQKSKRPGTEALWQHGSACSGGGVAPSRPLLTPGVWREARSGQPLIQWQQPRPPASRGLLPQTDRQRLKRV